MAEAKSDDPFTNPDVVALQGQITEIDDKIKELQKDKAVLGRKMRSLLGRLITKKLAERRAA